MMQRKFKLHMQYASASYKGGFKFIRAKREMLVYKGKKNIVRDIRFARVSCITGTQQYIRLK